MLGISTGFAVVGVAIITGYVIGRIDLLGEAGGHVLGRLSFFVLSPFLMFTVLSDADIGMLFSSLLPVSAAAAVSIAVVYLLISKLAWRRLWGDVVVGSLSSMYANANNIGIPIATYLLGNAVFSAPIILMQQLVFTPLALTALDAITSGEKHWWKAVGRVFHNPLVIGSTSGLVMALLDVDLPRIIHDPVQLIANAAVPVILISFGMSLRGQRVLTTPGTRRDALLATVLKVVAMPVVAYLLGRFAFHLNDASLHAVVVLAALPSGQNVFNYAQRYDVGLVLARDAVFLTTVACMPVIVLITVILGS
ncbi:transporter [Microbacterium nanhaiense]|uniref:Transporter n=1 Tax=Microbacterium nanhaiense TaxID=1301026 RepID=A0ABQ2N3R5_9MICO|nr:AEC family transporter [Microbacterium nanhaiense]GGO65864.1 transporter [Microbacterium nanhaiense]